MASCRLPGKTAETYRLMSLPERYRTETDSLATEPIPLGKNFFSSEVLKSLIDTALANSFDIRESVARIDLARAGVRLNTGLDLPTLETVASIGQRKFGRYTIDGVGNYDTKFSSNLDDKQQIPDPFVPDLLLGFQSSWEIDLWGRLKNQKQAAVERLLQSESYKNLVITELVSEVATAYYELLVKDGELKFLDEIQRARNCTGSETIGSGHPTCRRLVLWTVACFRGNQKRSGNGNQNPRE
jgi:outer membrane protein TolC